MKITVLTLGSRGDVQPYVALGKELVLRGHEVTICTGGTFKSFVENNGINFYEATIDFMQIIKTDEGQAIINGGGNLFKIMKYAKEVINPLFRKTFDDFLVACKDTELIIYHPKALVACDIAEYMNIPCLSLPPVPMIYPITEFANLAVSPKKSLGSFLNRLSYSVNKFGESSNMKDINEFRTETLHLPKRKTGTLYEKVNGKAIPIVYPVSPSLFEEVTSWNGHVELTGFFYMDLGDVQLEPSILEFIEGGKAPIIVSFSSMPLKNPEKFRDMLIEALDKTANRAIVLTGVSGLNFTGHDNIMAVEKAPHRLLFKLGKGIIHHGGVGTMSEALLSGVPQVIMPFNVDQPFWANRLYKLGYALTPLNEKKLSTTILEDTFNKFEDKDVIQKAKEISSKIASENGISTAADYIERRFKNA